MQFLRDNALILIGSALAFALVVHYWPQIRPVIVRALFVAKVVLITTVGWAIITSVLLGIMAAPVFWRCRVVETAACMYYPNETPESAFENGKPIEKSARR